MAPPSELLLGVAAPLAATAAGTTMLIIWRAFDSLRSIGMVIAIGGVAWLCTARLIRAVRATNRPADDAWHEGYEAGYDKGWRDAHPPARLIHMGSHAAKRHA